MNHNNKLIYLGLLFSLLALIESCIDPVMPKLSGNDSESLLVVDGQITNEEGPFRVKLTTSVPINLTFSPQPVLNANVRIADDQGNSFQLLGDSNGTYETADKTLRGLPDNTYTLYITTPDSVKYISSPVLMQEVPDIDNVYFEEVTNTRFDQTQTYQENWLNILVDTHDANNKNKYWQYEFEETWEVIMISDHVKVLHNVENPSDFSFENINQSYDKKICWVTMPSTPILIASTVNQPVDELKGFLIQSLGPGEAKLHIRYSILVRQFSISPENYNYWKQMKTTNENAGGIYSTVPAPVFGNITSLNGTKKALGYFSASSVTEKRLFINNSDQNVQTININDGCSYFDYALPSWIPKSYFGQEVNTGTKVYTSSDFCADCTSFGTNVKPSYW